MNARSSSSAGPGARVPTPPGTMRTSRGGAVVNVCVGTTLWWKVEPMGFPATMGEAVETASRVEAMRERVSLNWREERRLRTSRVPKTSRAWKPGKRSMP